MRICLTNINKTKKKKKEKEKAIVTQKNGISKYYFLVPIV